MPAKAKKRARKEEKLAVNAVKSIKREPVESSANPIDSHRAAQLQEVISALSCVKDLPPFVVKILGRMIPKSLGEPESLRHRHQQRVVEMVRSSIDAQASALQSEVSIAMSDLKEAKQQLDIRKGEASAAEDLLAQEKNKYNEQLANNEQSRALIETRRKELDIAQAAQREAENNFVEAESTKLVAEQVIEKAVLPWKEGTLQADVGVEWSEKLSRFGQKLHIDAQSWQHRRQYWRKQHVLKDQHSTRSP
jgi:hypothetical protein